MQRLPLQHIKILDMSRVLAGPYATQLLSDLGAQVIKIESPSRGDDTRAWSPPIHSGSQQSAYFMSANRNKQSVCIDLKSKYGPHIIQQLTSKCDVFIENFKVDALQKFNLDYQSLLEYNRKLIYCSISGYGQNGPRKHEPGYDFVMQAKSGLMSITGPDQTVDQDGVNSNPYKVGTAIVDVMTGMYAVTAILSSIIKRQTLPENEQHGEYIDLSLFDVSLSLLANQSMNYLVSGNSPNRLGNRHPNIVPYELLEAKDGQIVVAVGNDSQFQSFVKILFANEPSTVVEEIIHNEKFRTNKARVGNRADLLRHLQPQLLKQTPEYWETRFLAVGIPCSRVNNIQQAFSEEQVASRNMIWNLTHESSGTSSPFVGSPIHFSSVPHEQMKQRSTFPPDLGASTEDILSEILGASPNEIQQWKNAGTFGK